MAGILRGLAGILFYHPSDHSSQVFTLLVLAGVTAGASNSMTADHATYRTFVLLSLTPIGAVTLSRGEQLQTSIGVLAFLLLVLLLKSSRVTALSIIDLLNLRYQNAILIQDLGAADNDGMISFIDGKQLGNQSDLQLPAVGENLRQVFADHPQIVYETRRALGDDGAQQGGNPCRNRYLRAQASRAGAYPSGTLRPAHRPAEPR